MSKYNLEKYKGKKVLDLVREFFPKSTDEEASELLWSRTGYPSFFHGNPVKCIRKSLRAYKRLIQLGKKPCDFCDKPAKKYPGYLCRTCLKAINAPLPNDEPPLSAEELAKIEAELES